VLKYSLKIQSIITNKGGYIMKLSDLTKAKDPVTGQTTNIFDVGDILSRILGVVLFFVIFAAGQNAASKVGKVLPIDTTIDPIVNKQTVPINTKVVL
jgi:hypothetical protein